MSQAQIKALNARVGELEDQLKAHQQQIVNTCAAQLQSLFQNQVLVDSLTHRMLIAAANALAHKASQSQERAPELVVLEGYIPGALRAIFNEDGSMTVEQQLKGAVNAGGNWESATAFYEEKGILTQFAQLMAAYGAEAGRVYYITDTVTASAHRDKLAREMAANVTATEADDDVKPGEESVLDAVTLELKLNSDFTKITSVIFPLGTVVHVTRGPESLTIPVDEVQDEDIIALDEAEQSIDWVVTSSSLTVLPPTGEPLPEAGEGLEADGIDGGEAVSFEEGTSVRVITKPYNTEFDGQVELAGDEFTAFIGVYDEYTVVVPEGTVQKAAWTLEARDVVQVARNGQIVKEVVVSAEADLYTTDGADFEAGEVNDAAPL